MEMFIIGLVIALVIVSVVIGLEYSIRKTLEDDDA
jgi:uncharacterized membrane protein